MISSFLSIGILCYLLFSKIEKIILGDDYE